MNDCRDVHLRDDLKCFSQQLLHHFPVVSCGLFNFDWTLMFSIVSAVTTYLMILVQLDSSMTSSSNDEGNSTNNFHIEI